MMIQILDGRITSIIQRQLKQPYPNVCDDNAWLSYLEVDVELDEVFPDQILVHQSVYVMIIRWSKDIHHMAGAVCGLGKRQGTLQAPCFNTL